jgi:cell volume regulation protein A
MKLRRRFYISWVGLRGAVPIVFATYPLLAGIDKANIIFNIVFFVALSSVLIQGTTISLVAKWLNVGLPESAKKPKLTDEFMEEHPKTILREIKIKKNTEALGKQIVDLNFPKNAIIAMIERDDNYLIPNGSTILEVNDKIVVLTDKIENIKDVYACLNMDKE